LHKDRPFLYRKPYLTIPQQIALLQRRGMTIADEDRAAEYLQRIGYYRLSAYWHPMRQRTGQNGEIVEDNFVPGTTFAEATDLYAFDSKLRLLTLDALERMEVSLRTETALTLGRRGGKSYRETRNFGRHFTKPQKTGGPTRHRLWLQRFDKRFNESKDAFVEHFRQKYPGDDMPIWIAVELLDFGPLSHLISGMTFADLQTMGKNYGDIRPRQLQSWARSMAFVRNVCAHHARLWNKPLVNAPALGATDTPDMLQHLQKAPGGNQRFYAMACVLRFLLMTVNPRTTWRDRFISHIQAFPKSPRLSLSAAGFPDNWTEERLWT
jgi:abortive infection bacteriophage resistance protein